MIKRRGFTILELLFAMTFTAILVVSITVLVMNIQGIYRRGLALRQVNATSRSVVDDITRAIASAPAVSDTAYAIDFINGTSTEGGVFCTGFYSYVWKQADFLWQPGSATGGGAVSVNGDKDYRLLKVRDVGRTLCRPAALGLSSCPTLGGTDRLRCPVSGTHNLTAASSEPPVELISSGGLEIALFSFDIFQPAVSSITGQVFYSGSFILGTPRGANIQGGLVSTEVCQPPGEADIFDFQYCSINKFNFAASSIGSIGEG
ncbi:type II secretion system GspH family protein [Candidatus Saccharibacteria bacterium]|nr:type II secretion system GspH family protein [Candidatus Saccharibacteria bacterium]